MKLSLCVRSSLPRVGVAEPLAPTEDPTLSLDLPRVDASPRGGSGSSNGWLHIRIHRESAPRTAS